MGYVRLPSMGEGIAEASIVRWLSTPGTFVEKNQPLLEISTDKVDTEIIAEESGWFLGAFAKEGEVVRVGQALAQIGETASLPLVSPPETYKAAPKSTQREQSTSTARQGGSLSPRDGSLLPEKTLAGFVRSSPLVRKIAIEYGVDLKNVRGKGLYGRITKADLEEHIAFGDTRVPMGEASAPALPGLLDPIFLRQTEREGDTEKLEGVLVRREKMTKIRRLTAEHMILSAAIAPHVTTTFEIDMSPILKHKSESPAKLTLTAYFVWAAVRALEAFPICNATASGDDILYRDDINIALAVATDFGLMVPVLKNLRSSHSLEVISNLVAELTRRTRDKELRPDEVRGGTFSITNPGVFGSLHSQPMISQPSSAILGIGALSERCILEGGQVVSKSFSQLSLTFDHRIIDGEGGARFLDHMRQSLALR